MPVPLKLDVGSEDAIMANLTVVNLTVTGTETVASDVTFTGNTTIGDTSADTITVNASWAGMTAGSIPFFAGSPVTLQQDNTNLFWDSTNKRFGFGTTTPSSAMTLLRDVGKNATYKATVYGGSSNFVGQLAGGSLASPTAVVSGNSLSNVNGEGWDGTSFITSSQMSFNVTGTVSTGVVPAVIVWKTMSLAGTLASRMQLNSEGLLSLAASNQSTAGSSTRVDSAILVSTSTYAFTGATAQTGDVRIVDIGVQTLTNATSGVVPNASSLYITGSPAAGSGMTITNAYSIFSDSGLNRFDGQTLLGGGTIDANAELTVTANTAPTGSASTYISRMSSPAQTVAFATNPQTGDYTGWSIGQATITNPSSGTIANAVTLNVIGAPIASTNVTVTNTMAFQAGGATTIVSAAAATYKAINVPAHTVTITGTTPLTGAQGVVDIRQVTYSNATSSIISTVASLYIDNAPTITGGGTITSSYAIWSAAGSNRMDGALLLNSTAATSSEVIKMSPTASLSGGSSSKLVGFHLTDGITVAFTGGTAQTGDVLVADFGQATLTNATSGTVTNAATVKILGAPIAGSGMTITNAMSLWDSNGFAVFSGGQAVTASTREVMQVQYRSSIVGSSSTVIAGFRAPSNLTVAFTGGTAQTGDVRLHSLGAATLTNATSGTVGNAATLFIQGEPLAGSGMTITNSYALWISSGLLKQDETQTITGTVSDGYSAAHRLSPSYTAASAQTVTRHNYFDLNNVTGVGAGPASITDAAVFRFNAAAGTHKAVDSGTTKTTPGTVDSWLKVNINGVINYLACYTSKTS